LGCPMVGLHLFNPTIPITTLISTLLALIVLILQ
jgi:hypothetical protein